MLHRWVPLAQHLPFPCRAAIPLYDADTGLLVLAGKVRSHGSRAQRGAGGYRRMQDNAVGCSMVCWGAARHSGMQKDAGGYNEVHTGVVGFSRVHVGAVGYRRMQ